MSPPAASRAEAPEVARGRSATWTALVLVPVGAAVVFMLDTDAEPAVQGLLASLAALQIMLALYWKRSRTRQR
ncbi:hypothetical protein [Blastococcus tunisiensis]|uniref:Uncharacterized protein n=1 Tax=Blastococcus tunisiensis TaxID=1798228 RepID=A0A1I2HF54_9ACTN|nr:hypothetical protein [Blastococcus sp. DSM 46838]SFF28895.1 hypothetical protein SAMN05216574_11114 [Blastococcus sp. DSM 46838]